MPTYNPKQLGEPEVIREINPTVLFAFLQPFEGYLRSRGLVIKKEGRIDNAAIEKLVDILTNPTMKTPQALLNAVFYVGEMATPSAADLLLNAAQQAGMPFDEEGKHSLADIVMQVWLAPLSELGEDALSPGEIDAIEEIVLLNYRVRLGGPFNSYIIHGADDYFADLKWRGGSFQAEGSLDRATFRIKYRHVKARRTLSLYTGNSSAYTRDENARHVEQWLQLRRFVMKTGARAAKGVTKDDQAVASY